MAASSSGIEINQHSEQCEIHSQRTENAAECWNAPRNGLP
jgi:hypothetical protein